MDAKYYCRDIKGAKEQELLRLKKEKIRVMEYSSKFNELNRFAPAQVASEEMWMDHIEQGLKGSIKQLVVGTPLLTSRKCTRGL